MTRYSKDLLVALNKLTFMSDVFVQHTFNNNHKILETILNIIFKTKLKIKYVTTQKHHKPDSYNKASILDVLALSNSYCFNIEIQNKLYKTTFDKALQYLHTICHYYNPINTIRKNYNIHHYYHHVIYFIKGDFKKENLPICQFDLKNGWNYDTIQLNCDSIIFINVNMINNETDLGKLAFDFCCSDYKKMHYKAFKETMYNAKNGKGVHTMCDVINELMQKERIKSRKEGRKKGIIEGKMEGRKEGIVEGKEKQRIKTLENMLSAGITDLKLLLKVSELPLVDIHSIANRMNIQLN